MSEGGTGTGAGAGTTGHWHYVPDSYIIPTSFTAPSQSPLGTARSADADVYEEAWRSVALRFRHPSQLAPRKVTFIKRHKGVIPIPTGGSIKGTTLAYGHWGLRIKGEGVRLTAKQFTTAEESQGLCARLP